MKKIALALVLFGALGAVAHADEPVGAHYQIVVPPPPPFVPTKVWDDGKFTYIQLASPYHGELPAIISEPEPGKFALVQFRWDPKTSQFVVQQLVDRLVLKAGDRYVEINRS